MKIRKLFLSLLLSGVALGSVSAQQPIKDPAPATTASASRNASRHIGDAAPAVAVSGGQPNYQLVQYDPAMQQLAPGAMSYDPNMLSSGCGCGSGSCSSGGCGTSCGSSCGCGPNMWFGAETLLWWGQKREVAPLLTTAPQGVLPVAGAPGVTTVVGGPDAPLDPGLLPGYRLSGGMYFGPEQSIGLSGRVFGIFRNSSSITRPNDGTLTTSVGLPFFDPLIGVPNAVVVQFDNGAPVFDGSATVTHRQDLIAAEPSLRLLASKSCDHRIDLLGGYTFLRLKDSLTIDTTSTDRFNGNLIPDGTVTTTNDVFAARNTFHGGHLGLESTVKKQRVSLTTLSKVSFGNMNQFVRVDGVTNVGLPPAAPIPTVGGVYTQQSNIGTFERNAFAFIPELGLKGGLAVRSNVQLTVGYTFLYISKAALASNQIDPIIDINQAQGGPAGAQPALNYRDGSTWFQGVDLGLNWTF